jgi:hypothetical protein
MNTFNAFEYHYVAVLPSGIQRVEDLLIALYEQLKLPGYFGFNWNALSDCLRDFHWIEEKNIILVHTDLPKIEKAELSIYLEILDECVENWKKDGSRAFTVIFPASCRELIESLN